MNKKSNWLYKKKKNEKRKSKREIKNSPRIGHEESIKKMNDLWAKYDINRKRKQQKEQEQRDENKRKELEQKELERKELERKELERKELDPKELERKELEQKQKELEIKERFSQDPSFRSKFLRVIRNVSHGEFGNSDADSFESLNKYEKKWFEHFILVIEKKIEELDKRESSEPNISDTENELQSLLNQIIDNEQKIEELTQKINRTKGFSPSKTDDMKRKEEIESATRKIKSKLHKSSLKFIKKPTNLKNNSKNYLESTKILLDANAIIHMISNYDITHGVKTLCPYETLLVYVPSFITDELKKKRVRRELSYNHIMSELNGIFGMEMRDVGFDPKIEEKVDDIKKEYVQPNGDGLSEADAKCLLYAKNENHLLITNDSLLKLACKKEHTKCVDQLAIDKFTQTINSNMEDWFVGKIKRMKKYWQEITELKTNNDSKYLESRNAFRVLLQDLIIDDAIFGAFLLKIYFSDFSLPKKAEKFFDLLPEKSDLTLEDIDITINKIPN